MNENCVSDIQVPDLLCFHESQQPVTMFDARPECWEKN